VRTHNVCVLGCRLFVPLFPNAGAHTLQQERPWDLELIHAHPEQLLAAIGRRLQTTEPEEELATSRRRELKGGVLLPRPRR